MKITTYCVHKIMNRENKEIEAQLHAQNSFFGWLIPRNLSKSDWEYIGKEMNWKQGEN